MSLKHRSAAPSLLLALLAASGAFAQSPAALPQLDVATTPGSQFLASAALDALGNVTLLWTQNVLNGHLTALVRGRRFSRAELPLGPDIVFEKETASAVEVAANARGDFIAIWNRSLAGGGTGGVLRRVSPSLRRLNLRFDHRLTDVALDQAGNFVVIWGVETPAGGRVFGQRFNPDGSKQGPEFNAATSTDGSQIPWAVAMNPVTGEFVVIWQKGNLDGSNRRLFGQRFGFATGRQGSEFQITAQIFDADERLAVDIGRARDGRFIVGWSRHHRFAEATTHIFAQRFDNEGNKAEGEIVVADDAPITDGYMRLAVGPQGQFVTAWDDGGPPLFVRAYRLDGTPAGPARELKQSASIPFPGGPELAFGFDGTYVLAWNDFIGIHEPDDDNWEINFQRFAAAPGLEICFFQFGRFRCDTDRRGPALEVDHRFGGGAGTAVPLGRLGDLDGDGRADPCVVRKGRFLCDTGHDFGRAEVQIPYGLTGGQAVLVGDLDGDGRDDPCQYLAGHFRCDTAHDGPAGDVDIAFGAEIWSDRGSEGVALLGDVDGDGRDDPCVTPDFTGELRCDTAHDGGAPETVISFFDLGNGAPILADFDGDGRDDPCSFIIGIFRCDTAHDGGTAELKFSLGPGVLNAWPLIGNLDGV